jgi:Holliday junction resolvase
MSGGSKNKRAGSSYEYRLKAWFEEKGWTSKRVALSGAVEEIGRHDVHAWKSDIYLTVEAKKRTRVKDPKKRDQIEIKAEWLENIYFDKDEILVVATDRSPHYCFIPTLRFFQILGRSFHINYDKSQIYNGNKQFVFKRDSIDNSIDKRYHLEWMNKPWTVLLLDEFLLLRETATLNDSLSLEDRIRRLSNLEKATEFESHHVAEMNYNQKRLLYSKLEELESGSFINPLARADEQFWLGDEAFIVACPHCKEKITKKDLKEEG